jgi:hypothetical protein
MSLKKDTQHSATPALAGGARESTSATGKKVEGFTAEERAAMQERAKERDAGTGSGHGRAAP